MKNLWERERERERMSFTWNSPYHQSWPCIDFVKLTRVPPPFIDLSIDSKVIHVFFFNFSFEWSIGISLLETCFFGACSVKHGSSATEDALSDRKSDVFRSVDCQTWNGTWLCCYRWRPLAFEPVRPLCRNQLIIVMHTCLLILFQLK